MSAAATAAAVYEGGKQAIGMISDLNDAIDEAKDRGINSLSAYTKQTMITSRVYIEDAIAAEPIVPNLLKLLNQMYAGMVLTALNLGQIVNGSRTVRRMISPVSTEVFQTVVDMIKEQFGDKNVEVKALEDNKGGSTSGNINAHNAGADIDASSLFTGRLMEVTLGDKDNKVNLYFLVQLFPYILPGLVMEEFISVHTDPATALRKAQWKAGEIRFWKDFIFECDRVEKRRKALRLDKDGILHEVEANRSHNLWKSIKNFFGAKTQINRNAANTIIVISKQKLDRICKDLGINIKNFKDRQNILGNTLSLMMVVYDPNYETVELYLNGITARGEYTAQMIDSACKKKDGDIDMKQLLTIIAAGNVPKF